MKINAVAGTNDEKETFTCEFHAEVLDFNDVDGVITWSQELFEIAITNSASYLRKDGEVGLALLDREQAKKLYDCLGEFLNEDVS